MKSALRILIVEDDADTQSILVGYLTWCGYSVWAASDSDQALAWAEAQPLDVALVDVVMPGLSGIELIPRLRSLQPGLIIILLTAYGTIDQAVAAIRLGAFDYLEKPLQPKQVRRAVERAWQARGKYARALQGLSERERQVLRLLAEGKSDSEIAAALRLSVRTVNTHVQHILTKTGAENRVQAARLWNLPPAPAEK